MKLTYPLAALAAVLVLAGCQQTRHAKQFSSEQLTPEEQVIITISTAKKQRNVTQQDVYAAVNALKAYMAEQRAVFVASVQASLTDMDQKIAQLGDTIASLNTDEEAQVTFNSMRELRFQLDPLVEDLTKMNVESWYDTQRAFQTSLAELEKAYKQAKDTYDL